ncbi:MAG: VOC family protein [Egibacteraceae bacterium]
MGTPFQVTFDCASPGRLAEFWALALGYILQPPPEGCASWQEWLIARGVPESDWDTISAIVDPDGDGPRILFMRVPEPKTVKNRLHLDINAGGSLDTPSDERRVRVDATVARLRDAGATQVREAEDMHGARWIVLRDPEGNEFCVQ